MRGMSLWPSEDSVKSEPARYECAVNEIQKVCETDANAFVHKTHYRCRLLPPCGRRRVQEGGSTRTQPGVVDVPQRDVRRLGVDPPITDRRRKNKEGGDTYGNRDSLVAASVAVAGTLQAVDAVVKGEVRNAFMACRPPGHHALRDGRPEMRHAHGLKHGLGFCIINYVACAAKHAVEDLGLDRVTVVDVDVHHGNGTQDILCKPICRSYQYISIHLEHVFPHTAEAETSDPPYVVNLVVRGKNMTRTGFREKWQEMREQVDAFRPDMILVSAGYDGLRNDPMSVGGLRAKDYYDVIKELQSLADKHCGGRMVAVMEGGYCCKPPGGNKRIGGSRAARPMGKWIRVRAKMRPLSTASWRRVEPWRASICRLCVCGGSCWK